MAFEQEIEVLERLRDENDGLLKVDAIVEEARDRRSPLHKHFDWDDTSAAEKYREWQARALIQKCRIVIENRSDVMVRAFVSVPTDRKEGGYRAVQEVLDSTVLRQSLLNDMRKRIAYWQTQHYLYSGEIFQALNTLRASLDDQDEQRPAM